MMRVVVVVVVMKKVMMQTRVTHVADTPKSHRSAIHHMMSYSTLNLLGRGDNTHDTPTHPSINYQIAIIARLGIKHKL